jgi:hypothetical protein
MFFNFLKRTINVTTSLKFVSKNKSVKSTLYIRKGLEIHKVLDVVVFDYELIKAKKLSNIRITFL